MARFVRFTTADALDVRINVDHITHVWPGEDRSTIALVGHQSLVVRSPGDEVMQVIEGTL